MSKHILPLALLAILLLGGVIGGGAYLASHRPESMSSPEPSPSPVLAANLQAIFNAKSRDATVDLLGKPQSTCRGFDYFPNGIVVQYAETPDKDCLGTEPDCDPRLILLESGYKGAVCGGLRADASDDAVRAALGEPDFTEDAVYGYKLDGCYLFVSQNTWRGRQFALYKSIQRDLSPLPQIVENLKNKQYEWLIDLQDALADAFPAPDRYLQNGFKWGAERGQGDMQYTTNGIYVFAGRHLFYSYWTYNWDNLDSSGDGSLGDSFEEFREPEDAILTLYGAAARVVGDVDCPWIACKPDVDLCFEAEKRRLERDEELRKRLYGEYTDDDVWRNGVIAPDGKTAVCKSDEGRIDVYGTVVWHIDETQPPVEFKHGEKTNGKDYVDGLDNISNIVWLDNRYVVFSTSKRIHSFVLDTQTYRYAQTPFNRSWAETADVDRHVFQLNRLFDDKVKKSVDVPYVYDETGFPRFVTDNVPEKYKEYFYETVTGVPVALEMR